MSNRFVKPGDLLQIDLGDGDWVKVPSRFSYGFVQNFSDIETGDVKKIAGFLLQMLKEWNLKDGDEIAEIDQEHLESLDVDTFKTIMEAVTKLLTLPKVEKLGSEGQSEEVAGMKPS